MKTKTSVYLAPDQAARLEKAASESGRSEADLIREGIELVLLRAHKVQRSRRRHLGHHRRLRSCR
ncbi:ribbon-helix-helix domain-containing protein [Nocardia sp. NPDC052278]|uniref:ribbon-helix-helix domain-containing protein n=1 Tax=unclassified Nocardia TaxID=2637762 RepID=UPI003688E3F4